MGKALLPCFPNNYVAAGALVLATPVGNILRAVHFDSSSFSRAGFYVKVIFQPLYIPLDHLILSFGKRLDDQWKWDGGPVLGPLSEALKQDAVPHLERIKSPEDFPTGLERLGIRPTTLGVAQAVAFSYARARHWEQAGAQLNALPSLPSGGRDWEEQILDEGRRLLAA